MRNDSERNFQAAVTLANLLGGMDGMRAEGLSLRNLMPILDADPDDGLEGLRSITDRMALSTSPKNETPPNEPFMEQKVAEWWVLRSGRAKIKEGILIRTDNDHISQAAFRVATSMQPQQLSGLYREVTTAGKAQINSHTVSEMSSEIITNYRKAHPNS